MGGHGRESSDERKVPERPNSAALPPVHVLRKKLFFASDYLCGKLVRLTCERDILIHQKLTDKPEA